MDIDIRDVRKYIVFLQWLYHLHHLVTLSLMKMFLETGYKAFRAKTLLLVLLTAGCVPRGLYNADGPDQRLQTLTNLHYDTSNNRVYSLNFQQQGLIPVCSEVRIDRLTRAHMLFTVIGTGRQYEYVFMSNLEAEPRVHLHQYFGPDCQRETLGQLSRVDQAGVRQGVVSPGMSRRAVILAIGHSPLGDHSGLRAVDWQYWVNRFNSFIVRFDAGGVFVHELED